MTQEGGPMNRLKMGLVGCVVATIRPDEESIFKMRAMLDDI